MTDSAPDSADVFERFDALYEFDREPVSEDKLESGRHFAALYAGEHVAGTEFVIGALFVTWGAGTKDILLGLLLGNLLAVLSWTFVCAPIAVQTRLTLYWYLRRIAGPLLTACYNVLNAFLYCILAGAMITVAASAVRIPFGIAPQTKWYPEDYRFVLVVLAVGAVVVCLAILGFKRLAQFSSICVPWVFGMFFAGGLAMLPGLAATVPEVGTITSFSDFWQVAEQTIWTGHTPDGGPPAIGFWHIVSFAWICNLAMHLGLSDMAILRYAKTARYGMFSAFGMYFGHYVAWICAGIMGAATAKLLDRAMSDLDAGEVAFQSLGVAGAIATVIAGWTTSNPTLYRAGLALQAITPGWPRWFVTLLAGAVTTLIACSPFVFTKLLGFVALYGILLMPIGTIVVVEHWIFPRIGLTRFWATTGRHKHNWPALIAWVGAMIASYALFRMELVHEFFLAIPIWFLTAVTYTGLAALSGAKTADAQATEPVLSASRSPERPTHASPAPSSERKLILTVSGTIALAALALCIALPIWVFFGGTDYAARMASSKQILAWASVIHLVTCAVWVLLKEQRVE